MQSVRALGFIITFLGFMLVYIRIDELQQQIDASEHKLTGSIWNSRIKIEYPTKEAVLSVIKDLIPKIEHTLWFLGIGIILLIL